MYRDGFQEPGWLRVLRWLSASFRLGTFFGVEVRVYWLTLIVMPLICLTMFGRWGISAAEVWTFTVIVTMFLYFIVYTHEMSHILAGRRFGVFSSLITLSPIGGLAHMSSPVPNPRSDVVISLAGPSVHLLWLAVVWPLTLLVSPDAALPSGWSVSPLFFALDFLLQANLWLMIFNLLPLFPLDGGRVLRAVLSMRMHSNRATLIAVRVGQVGAVGLFVWGLVRGETWGTILVVIAISNFLSCWQELRAARYHAGPYQGEARAPWEADPDAWKGKGGRWVERERKPGRLARWRARCRDEVERARRDRETDLAAEVDRVLDRVNEVGLEGLTRKERQILERASKARRNPPD